MQDKNLPQLGHKSSIISTLERSNKFMNITQKVLQQAKVANGLGKTEDNIWIDRLYD